MNMLGLMERLTYTYLLIVHCSTFVCIYGSDQNLFSPCDVSLMVPRGTTLRAAPLQSLTLRCPVQHCGQALNVTWCKLLDTGKCKLINSTENGEIKPNDVNDKMITTLTFERISIHDDGLYHCYLKGYSNEQTSHIINVSVSDLHQGIENSDNNANELSIAPVDEDASWLPYFFICLGIALLVASLTLLTFLSVRGWKRILIDDLKKTWEMSNAIPDLPTSTVVVQTHFSTLNDNHSPSTAERPPSQLPLTTSGKQPAVANTAEESQVSEHGVYAVINRCQIGIPIGEKYPVAKQNENTAYSVINVS